VNSASTRRLAATATSALLTGLVLAAPGYAAPSYGSNGVFAVGTEPREGWATTFIPPGRYRVDQSPSMYPYLSPPGFWLRCNNFPCAGNFPAHIIATGHAVRDQPTFMDILPTDVAVSMHNVTLTAAG
jgi:hypothetical protein